MKAKYFNPTANKTYINKNGIDYICISSSGFDGTFKSLKSGWTFQVHGCLMYEDGTIEWNYSTGGYFSE